MFATPRSRVLIEVGAVTPSGIVLGGDGNVRSSYVAPRKYDGHLHLVKSVSFAFGRLIAVPGSAVVLKRRHRRASQRAQPEEASPSESFIIIDPKAALDGSFGNPVPRASSVVADYDVYVASLQPPICLVPDFLSDAEVYHLLNLAADRWRPSMTTRKDGSTSVRSETRTSSSCSIAPAETSVVQAIEERLSTLTGMSVDHLEPLNMIRYAPGEFFSTHHDGPLREKTVFIYLNDLLDKDGGETRFPRLGLQVRPRKGCAVLWQNVKAHRVADERMVHCGMPPRNEYKYGVNCFFADFPIRTMS